MGTSHTRTTLRAFWLQQWQVMPFGSALKLDWNLQSAPFVLSSIPSGRTRDVRGHGAAQPYSNCFPVPSPSPSNLKQAAPPPGSVILLYPLCYTMAFLKYRNQKCTQYSWCRHTLSSQRRSWWCPKFSWLFCVPRWYIELGELVVVMPSYSCQLQPQCHVGRCRLFLYNWIVVHHLRSPALFAHSMLWGLSGVLCCQCSTWVPQRVDWLIYFWEKQMAWCCI